MAGSTVGVLVVRVWMDGDPPTLRARITRTVDIEGPERVSTVVGTADEVLSATRAWLDAYLAGATVTQR